MQLSESREYLIFAIGDHQFAVPLCHRESRDGRDTAAPQCAAHVIGLSNLRGEVLGVISLAKKFGLKERLTSTFRAMVVFQNDSSGIAAVVDQVSVWQRLLMKKLTGRLCIYSD